jgi:hypothetical protein
VIALRRWLRLGAITTGPVFRGIDRWDHVALTRLDPGTAARIIKGAVAMAGLAPGRPNYQRRRCASRRPDHPAAEPPSLPIRHGPLRPVASLHADVRSRTGRALERPRPAPSPERRAPPPPA